jgi:hypothetical protein
MCLLYYQRYRVDVRLAIAIMVKNVAFSSLMVRSSQLATRSAQ